VLSELGGKHDDARKVCDKLSRCSNVAGLFSKSVLTRVTIILAHRASSMMVEKP
jgi:hypothetical protein